MKKEKSCGAIIIKYIENELYILLLKHNENHWSYPKGHIEENETEIETALREIKEETNLDVEINSDFREVITYSSRENIMKDVVYFLATPISDNIIPQSSEIKEIKWINREEAIKLITYNDDRDLLIKALNYLKNKK